MDHSGVLTLELLLIVPSQSLPMESANTSTPRTGARALLTLKAVMFPFSSPVSKNTFDCSLIGSRYILGPFCPVDLEVEGFTRESVCVSGNHATCGNYKLR